MQNIDELCVNAVRVLAADMIEKAKSGHPGMPLGASPMAYELWSKHLKIDPAAPQWQDRDRFVLSGGHASAMLYALLHLFGYDLTMDDLKNFRQLGSSTPGHPELGVTPGVDVSTGPLGAGFGMAVGMAIAEEHLAATFNKPGFPVVDHYTFALGGDGCFMEGISSEAFSLAGTLGLAKLIVLYDSNRISIEGSTDIAFTEDVAARMRAFGWQTLEVADGNDLAAIGAAIEAAKADKEHPSFIKINTHIGYASPKVDSESCHGSPLGADALAALKENLGWEHEPFCIPEEIRAHFAAAMEKGKKAHAAWEKLMADYAASYPAEAALYQKYHSGIDAEALLADEDFWAHDDAPAATRNLSNVMLNRLKSRLPQLIGGSADLASSNKTVLKGEKWLQKGDFEGSNIHFGVRELAMAAIVNGLAAHGGAHAYAATFFVFSDYLKPMMRLACLMGLPVTYIFTHDSIGVGEDGPTHEPIEQLSALRAVPNLHVFRPADATETAAAYYVAAASEHTPVALALSRQNLPQLAGSSKEALKGGYIVAESAKAAPDCLLMASGSEVELALKAKEILAAEGLDARVVSMPCTTLFDMQSAEYKESVLPSSCTARVAIEAGSSLAWGKYLGLKGTSVTIDRFGASAPAAKLFASYGLTAEHVAEAARSVIKK